MNEGHVRKSHEHRIDLAGEYKWGDTGQLIFIIVFIIGLFIDLFIIEFSNVWQDLFPLYFRIVIFLALFFSAIYLGRRSHRIIFKEERKKLLVIDKDVYSLIRHPMYFASILTYLGFVILSFSIVAFVIFVLIFIFYYYLCIYEEKLLIENLGDDYKKYMKKVPMFIPKINKY